MKRQIAISFLVGAGIGFSGCQSPSLGGLSLWNRNNATLGSTAPDVGKQKFNGLSQLAGDSARGGPSGAGMGSAGQAESDGFLMASWKKTTNALTGGGSTKPKTTIPVDDPLRLDRVPKKIGPEVYVAAARLLENQGSYAEAEGKYREALKAAPQDLAALVGLARLYDRQGQPQKAIETYQKAAQAHPTNGLVFNDMGLCYRRQQQLDKSLTAFRKAVELQKENGKYRNNLAAALVDAGRADEAFHELSALNSPAVAHYNLAYLLNQKGQRPEAVRHLQEAVDLDAGLSPARDMLAQLGAAAPAPTAKQAAGPSISRSAARPLSEPSGYALGAGESSIYTSAPQIEPASETLPPSFHVGDDAAAPAAQTAQRTNWSSAAWALPPGGEATTAHSLPPVE